MEYMNTYYIVCYFYMQNQLQIVSNFWYKYKG
jgi:hypothetical protein